LHVLTFEKYICANGLIQTFICQYRCAMDIWFYPSCSLLDVL
jgi:hypothetical protein